MSTTQDAADPILITGCPRSGTKYIATLLTEMGLDIRHEEMGRDGISSWFMAVDAADAPYGPSRHGQRFRAVLHQVRNPLSVIPSMSTLSKQAWEFACGFLPCGVDEPLWIRCATLWHQWNLHAQGVAQWRYRIEELRPNFATFCQKLNIVPDYSALDRVEPNVNTRAFIGLGRACKYFYAKLNIEPPRYLRNRFTDRDVYQREGTFSWDTLRRLDKRLCDQVIDLAKNYGYTDSDLHLTAATAVDASVNR